MFTKAMIVDDNALDRKILSTFLRSLDILSVECSDAFDALEKMESTTIDIIFVDINMPRINGFKFLQRINSYCERNSIPILMMSGTHLEKSDVLRTLKGGASDFVVKPISIDILDSKIDSLRKRDHLVTHTRVELPKSTTVISSPIEIITLDPHGIVAISNNPIALENIFCLNNSFLEKYGILDLEVKLEKSTSVNGRNLVYFAFNKPTVENRSRLKKLYNSLVEKFKIEKRERL